MEKAHARIGPRPAGHYGAGSQPASLARRSISSHKLLRSFVEALAAFQCEVEIVIDNGKLDAEPFGGY